MCLSLGAFALNRDVSPSGAKHHSGLIYPHPQKVVRSELLYCPQLDLGVDGEEKMEGEGYNVGVFLIQLPEW